MKRRAADRHGVAICTRRGIRLSIALLVMLGVTAGAAALLSRSQEHNERELEQRFAARTELAAGFVSTWTEQLMQREHDAARAELTDGAGSFDAVVNSFGFPAALLLDEQGRVLAVKPSNPQLLGTEIASKYPHLQAALRGVRAVSPVVPSAVTGEPIVAFAVPFQTPSGRRVFSGAHALRRTPLTSYLDGLTSLPGSRVHLVDEAGQILTNSGPADPHAHLSASQPLVADAASDRTTGVAGRSFFVASAVSGTPWRMVTTVPATTLLHPAQGPARYMPWVILALLVITAFGVCVLMFRLLRGRDHLNAMNVRLDLLAQTDVLTGVRNRRSTTSEMARLYERMQTSAQPLAVLMVDVDHFKRINDTFGHCAGDAVLIEVAARLRRALRDGDVIGRWGGEEFVIVLPNTDNGTAADVSDRIRASVSGATISAGGGGDDITVTVSVGSASSLTSPPEVLVAAADRALYLAKHEGRNRVRAAVC